MFKLKSILPTGIIMMFLFFSCEQIQEVPKITTEDLPEIELVNTTFLRGISTVNVAVKGNNLVAVNDVQVSINDQFFGNATLNENNEWSITINSEEYEDAIYNFTFEANISSESVLPQNSIISSVNLEVDNFLPTIKINQGELNNLDYENEFEKREGSSKSLIILDKELNPISELYDLNNYNGEITLKVPSNNQDQTFYYSVADYHKMTYFKGDAEIDSIDANTDILFKAISSSTQQQDENDILSEIIEEKVVVPVRKRVAVGYPADFDSILTIKFNYADSLQVDTINNIIYYGYDIFVEDNEYNYPFYFNLHNIENDTRALVLTNQMSDKDSFLINENFFTILPDQINYKVGTNDSRKFTQIVTVNGEKFYFDAQSSSKKGNASTEIFTRNIVNTVNEQFSYIVHHTKFDEYTSTMRTTQIENLSDTYEGLYSPSMINYTSVGGIGTIKGNKYIEDNYYSEIKLSYSTTDDSVSYSKVNIRFNTKMIDETLVADFNSLPEKIKELHGDKYSVISNYVEFTPSFSYYKIGTTLDDSYFNVFYQDVPIVEEEIIDENDPISSSRIRRFVKWGNK